MDAEKTLHVSDNLPNQTPIPKPEEHVRANEEVVELHPQLFAVPRRTLIPNLAASFNNLYPVKLAVPMDHNNIN